MDTETLQRARRDYLEGRIRSAHPVEIVAMLFQVAIDNLNLAIEHLKTRDHFARSRAVTRAEEAVHELLTALDHSVFPSFSRTAADLYHYALRRITVGHANQSEQALREALAALSPLASAWNDVKDRLRGEPALMPAAAEAPQTAGQTSRAAYEDHNEAVGQRDWSV